MCKCTVSLGHAVHVLFALECAALLIVGVHDLGGEFVGHGLAATFTCEIDKIFH